MRTIVRSSELRNDAGRRGSIVHFGYHEVNEAGYPSYKYPVAFVVWDDNGSFEEVPLDSIMEAI